MAYGGDQKFVEFKVDTEMVRKEPVRNLRKTELAPKNWRKVRVVFIPKAGKSEYCIAKD